MGNIYHSCGTDVVTQICREYGAISTEITSKCRVDCNLTQSLNELRIADNKLMIRDDDVKINDDDHSFIKRHLRTEDIITPETFQMTCKFMHCLTQFASGVNQRNEELSLNDAVEFIRSFNAHLAYEVDHRPSCR
jgi:hypothetical protein